ncbi:MAG: PKD domain-containing protein, partial [Flavobacteriales bacterium]|nr:PKD domain-containing protein [Flavobacteriales bacterium]
RPTASFQASKQEICQGQGIQFTDNSSGSPTSWSWSFPGGTPSSSTAQNPTVTYNTPGTYSVTLTVSNAGGSHTLTQPNYITVHPNPAQPVITQVGNALQSSYPTGNQWSLNGTPIAGATGATYQPSVSGNYTVTYTDGNGCSSTSDPYNFQFTGLGHAEEAGFFAGVFPVPAEHLLYVRLSGPIHWPIRAVIQDATGRILRTLNLNATNTALQVGDLASGAYVLTLQNGSLIKSLFWLKR